MKNKKMRVDNYLKTQGFLIQLFGAPTPTRIADVIIPEIFAGYINKNPLELNAFYQSGVLVRTPEFDSLAAGPGYTINMPYWDELEGGYEQRKDNDDAGAPRFNKISAKKEVAVKCFDVYRAGASSFASELAGSDAMGAIQSKVGHKIKNLDQKRIFQLLDGVFASTDMSKNVLDISALTGKEAVFSPKALIRAQGLLGDRQDQTVAIAMHSATYTLLKEQNLITVQTNADQAGLPIEYYGKRRVIVDDAIKPDADGVYKTYLFVAGAIAYGRGGEQYPVEIGKIPHYEEEGITVRKNHIFHVRGTKWKGATDEVINPDVELIKGTNWEAAYPTKQIAVILLKHRVEEKVVSEASMASIPVETPVEEAPKKK